MTGVQTCALPICWLKMPVLLIRHAQSVNNSLPEEQRTADPGLTELGREQSRRLAVRLEQWQPELLLSSAFRRTMETTRVVAAATGLTPEVWVEVQAGVLRISGKKLWVWCLAWCLSHTGATAAHTCNQSMVTYCRSWRPTSDAPRRAAGPALPCTCPER